MVPQQDQYRLLHVQRPFVYENYELTPNQYQQECHEHEHKLQQYEFASSPWTLQETLWHSSSSWQGKSPPPLIYPENDVDMKCMSLGNCCTYNDTSLTTPPEKQYPMTDYFTCRRDSSSSSASSTSSSSSSSYEEMTAKRVNPVEQCSTTSNTTNISTSHRAYSRQHSTTGSGRPYQCDVCSRNFARRHDLERHTRVHTGVKPYVCPCCLKAFPRSDARGRHFRNEPKCRTGPEVLAFIKKRIRDTI